MKGKMEQPAAAEWNEDEAIVRAGRGDATAFERLYNAHCKRVYSLCLRMLKNAAEAEDLTQQVFLQVFRKISTFRGDSSFSTWLHRISVNAVLMHLRRNRPDEIRTDSLDDTTKNDARPAQLAPNNSSLTLIDRLNLARAVRKLAPGYKRLFLMHDVIGYKHHEIAALLGCSTGSSKSQLHKARKRLRQLLSGEEEHAEQEAVRFA
ncbi:MAG TPA: RNA polymerase sigma factor [Candidatus Acidoferrum sp.]|nr:RNA polymerase sigma factor [Candidatus Acidoferrum sp.]